ncbi:PilZ domain-containing protein [Nitrogeniibacter mangrovi]|uniref:PilZ domain-containing protein n=1 Tax=Nitrogeniibacter mangrovi TaxID=2016596 RepID=A0A6C1B5P3_9RHOO|nr:PilZ domain-containing protein [Nitrogeniibacter mangrovi]QID19011.1 PilZ domain-containing protein [Nitrogeniibacter mangrovi]
MTNARDDRRSARRIPLGCDALIQAPHQNTRYEARCLEISTGGLTLESSYVPQLAEVLDVLVRQPDGGVDRPPLHVRVEVKRCHRTESGQYQLGAQIVQVLK